MRRPDVTRHYIEQRWCQACDAVTRHLVNDADNKADCEACPELPRVTWQRISLERMLASDQIVEVRYPRRRRALDWVGAVDWPMAGLYVGCLLMTCAAVYGVVAAVRDLAGLGVGR